MRGASDRDLGAAMTAEGGRVLEFVLTGMRRSYVGAPGARSEAPAAAWFDGRRP